MEGTAVIITVFNKEKYLRDTIESVLSQSLDGSTTQPASTTQPFSIILCDDGSTDKSREICAEYAALYNTSKASVPESVAETAGEDSAEPNERSVPSVSVYDITDGEHRGVVGNFLHCLEFALSLNVRYISQIDSDDILADPYFITRQTAFLDSRPKAQAACSKFFLIGEKDTLSTARQTFSSNKLSNKVSATDVTEPASSVTEPATENAEAATENAETGNGGSYEEVYTSEKKSKTLSYSSKESQHPVESTHDTSGESTRQNSGESTRQNSGESSYQTSGESAYRDLRITPEVLLTKNNTLVAGGVTYRAEHLKEYLETFASEEDSTQDLPLWLFLSTKGSFWGTDIQSLAYRNLAESVSRSEDIETQLRFQQASLDTRLRFIQFLKNNASSSIAGNKLSDIDAKNLRDNDAKNLSKKGISTPFKFNYPSNLNNLELKARRLYQKKMLRHYAKLSPKAYPKQLKQALKSTPSLLFSKDLWRSLGVYLKNR